MNSKIRLSEEKKIQILELSKHQSYGLIAETTHVPKSTVYYFLKRVQERKSIRNLKASGRPVKLNRHRERILKFIRKNSELRRSKIISR